MVKLGDVQNLVPLYEPIIEKDFYVKLEDGSPGPLLATGYQRLCVGKRGGYLEFHPRSMILEELEIEPGQGYRFDPKWKQLVYYFWLRTIKGRRKVYFQNKTVKYADYLRGYFYMSPEDVVTENKAYKFEIRHAPVKRSIPV